MPTGKRKTHSEFISEMAIKHPNIDILSTYSKAQERIQCRCKIDGHEWSPKAYSLSNGQGCPICGHQKVRQHALNRRLSHEQFVSRLSDINPNIVVMGKYVTSSEPIQIKCKNHDIVWNARPNDLLRGHGCVLCGRDKFSVKKTKSHEKYVSDMKIINPNINIRSLYEGMDNRIKCECVKCNHIWFPKAANVYYNKTGCPACQESKGETYIKNWLSSRDIFFIPQYKFLDCTNKHPLPFDFAIVTKDLVKGLIEYDGIQHFEPVSFFGGEEELLYRQHNDEIKNLYAQEHSIPLLRCAYDQSFDEMSVDLQEFISEIYCLE